MFLLQAVLEEVVQAFGGWEAAVFLDSGVVNLDVDVAAWPVDDQVHLCQSVSLRGGYPHCGSSDIGSKMRETLGSIAKRSKAPISVSL